MSDFSIPGVGSSKYGSKELIEGLMKLERVPRDKALERVKALTTQRTVWQEFNRDLTTLRNDARALFSFRNPFNERVAKSANEDVLTATATREAVEQVRQVHVKRAAAADRFLSSDLPKDYKVPAGDYAFSVGEAKVELRFAGGSLQEFSEALGRKGRDLVRASVVSVTKDSKALVVESLKTGLANRLTFSSPDSERLALDAGILERVTAKSREFDPSRPLAWERPLDSRLVSAAEGRLLVSTGGEARLSLSSPVRTEGLVLELGYRLVRLEEAPPPARPPGPVVGPTGSIDYEGIVVEGAPSATGLDPWIAPAVPPRVEDRRMAFVLPSGERTGAAPLPELEDSAEPRTLRVELGALLPEAGGLALRNRDTTRRLEILSARIIDPAETGGWKPRRPVATAQDALVSVDGVEALRERNDIDDLIPGVTLQVKEASDKPVRLRIEPDREAAKDAIIAMVGHYNRLVAQMNILTRNDEKLIEEISYFTDEERKTATERLGLLQGDSTVSLLRSSLQRAMMEPYETAAGAELALLSQLGIGTDTRKPGSGQGFDAGKLRGYLEIEESTLDAALAANFEAARELFGRDSDGDLIMDSGVAFRLDAILKPYVETGGIIALKSGTLERQITGEKKTIEELDKQLARKEDELRAKYGMMEGALNRLEGTSSSIDQFNKNNSGGQ